MIDAHLHLQHLPHRQVIAEIFHTASQRGLKRLFCNAIKLDDCELLSGLASEYDLIVPFYGIHPWESGNVGEEWAPELEKFIRKPNCGMGEIGMDKTREIDLTKQREVFERQLELAAQYKKPVMIHCVRAWGEVMSFLEAYTGKIRFLMHGFRGSKEILTEIIKLGGYVTFSWKLFKQKYGEPIVKVKELIREVPLDRLLLETDFPYIGEKVFSTLKAEQYFECLKEIYRIAGEFLNMGPEELKERTEKNGTAFLHGTFDR